MPQWLDELIEEVEGEHDEKKLLRAILALQGRTYRRIEQMADELQAQIDAAIAADAAAIKAIGVRVDANAKILNDKLAELSAAAPHIDVTHTIAALQDLKGLADSIAAAPDPGTGPTPAGLPTGGPGSSVGRPGSPVGAAVTLDPATGKPLYTRDDPQDTTNTTWPVASVQGPGGRMLYTFNIDTGPTATGDGADGGVWHSYTGPILPTGGPVGPS